MSTVFASGFDSDGFITSGGIFRWPQVDLTTFYCEFDEQHYSDGLFASFNIERPESIARSVEKRKAEFLAGRYCAQRALSLLGERKQFVGIDTHRAPLWPQSIVGSISHCAGTAVAAVSRDSRIAGVGIDVEKWVSDSTRHNIEKMILSADESAWLAGSDDSPSLLFTLVFSLKESFFKAAFGFVGRVFDFDAVTVLSIDRHRQLIHFRVNDKLPNGLLKNARLMGQYLILPNQRVVTSVVLASMDALRTGDIRSQSTAYIECL